jgi:putative mycofactocin binding protein MftB
VFTDPKEPVGKIRRESSGYVVSPHVRVRNEEFGLLFYHTQNARLTFVRSGDLFRIQIRPDGERVIIAANEAAGRGKCKRILDSLMGKGLIFET